MRTTRCALRAWILGWALLTGCARKSEPAETRAPATGGVSGTEQRSPAPELAPPRDQEEDSDEAQRAAQPEPRPAPPPAAVGAPGESSTGAGVGRSRLERKDEALRPSKPKASAKKSDDVTGSLDSLDGEGDSDIGRAARELEANFEQLGDALRLSTPDCPGARQFGERICALSERICRIAEASDDPDELALCVDGRNRCAESQRRLSQRCP